MDTQVKIIGWVCSKYQRRDECPHQGVSDGPKVQIIVEDDYWPGLDTIDECQELEILTWMHLSDRNMLKCHPRGNPDYPMRGVFCTRSPDRPNPVGLHRVKLLGRENNILEVYPLEVVNNTPVIDIKPVLKNESDFDYELLSVGLVDQIIKVARDAWERGLLYGLNGNLSLRDRKRVIITCAGSAKGHLRPKDLVEIDLASGNLMTSGCASSEAPFHLSIYHSQPEAGAIVHTHPPNMLALSLQNNCEFLDVPLFEAGLFRDMLTTIPALTPGSDELAQAVAQAAKEYKAIFLKQHGLICWGSDLTSALALSEELEGLAKIQLQIRTL